jgi:PmbA protein
VSDAATPPRDMRALAERVVARAVAVGATAADAFAAESDAFSVQVRKGEVETTTGARDKGLGLRVFHGARSATASTSDLSPESVERFVAATVGLARLTQEDPYAGLPDLPPGAAENGVENGLELSDGGAVLPIADRIELARRAEAAALSADPRIDNSEGASFDSSIGEVAYARSDGFSGGYRISSYGLSVAPVARENGSMQRDYWYDAARHFADLGDPEAVGREAARRVLRRLGARQVATCRVPVVFDPETASTLLGHLAAAVSGGSVYRKASFLAGHLGEAVASPLVTVVDDARRPRGLGSRPFDGEGVPAQRHVVVEGGTLNTYLLDSYAARKLSLATTGNARRGLGSGPSAGATNFYLEPGQDTPEAIIGSVQSGLYVTELIGFGVNGVTGDYSRGAAGIWIEDGRLAYPVEEVTISGNLLSMFRGIEKVGDDLGFRRRVSAPTLLVAEMTVAGS